MRIEQKHLDLIASLGADYLARHGYTFTDVKTGIDAWHVLHKSGAYRAIGDDFTGGYPDYKDAHFQTALARLMPNAIFKDAKVY